MPSKAQSARALADAEALLTRRELRRALLAFDEAERTGAAPDRCSAGRWMVWMLCGEYRSAWRESDRIRQLAVPDPHRFWLGEPIAGRRLVVRALHGYGDAVQMLRYAPALGALASEVTYEVAPDLVELARCFNGVRADTETDRPAREVITWGEDAPATPPEFDVQVEVMELPYLFRTSMPELPLAERYLRLPAEALAHAATGIGPRAGKPRVGLVSASSDWDPLRTIPAAALDGLLRVPADWWSMDREAGLRGDPRLRHVREELGDGVLALAAAIATLDLVITVDTLAAHLAGALGRPVFLLLQHAADWRWMTARDDSPWYPGMKLFRQSTPGDWDSVLTAVEEQLVSGKW